MERAKKKKNLKKEWPLFTDWVNPKACWAPSAKDLQIIWPYLPLNSNKRGNRKKILIENWGYCSTSWLLSHKILYQTCYYIRGLSKWCNDRIYCLIETFCWDSRMLKTSSQHGACGYNLNFNLSRKQKDFVMNVKYTIIVFTYGSRAGRHCHWENQRQIEIHAHSSSVSSSLNVPVGSQSCPNGPTLRGQAIATSRYSRSFQRTNCIKIK